MFFRKHKESSDSFLFITNPISGGGHKDFDPIAMLPETPRKNKYISKTSEYPGHACELARQAVKDKYKAVIIAGGDGSVNEVARELAGSETALGIIPIGSGNGISRHFKISMNPGKAVMQFSRGKTMTVDTGMAGDRFFLGFSGVGFDAEIAKKFQQSKTRGIANYIKATVDCFFQFKPRDFRITSGNETIDFEGYAVVAANTSQFGNNAYIHPLADPQDGKFNVCLLKTFPKSQFPTIAAQLFLRSVPTSKYIEYIELGDFTVASVGTEMHVDGEPCGEGGTVHYRIVPSNLKVIVP